MLDGALPTENSAYGMIAPFDFDFSSPEDTPGFADLRTSLERNSSFPCLAQTCHDLKLIPTIRPLVSKTPGEIRSSAHALFTQLVTAFLKKIQAKRVIRNYLSAHSEIKSCDEVTLRIESTVRHAFANTFEVYVRKVLQHLIAAEVQLFGTPSIRQFNLLIWGILDEVVDKRVPQLVAEAIGTPVFTRYRSVQQFEKREPGRLLPLVVRPQAQPPALAA